MDELKVAARVRGDVAAPRPERVQIPARPAAPNCFELPGGGPVVSEISWPVEFVDRRGGTHVAESMAGAWQLVYTGCRLRRSVPGLPFKVAQPTRADGPREVTTWRGQEPAPPPSPDPESEASPPARPSRKSSRKA